MADQSSIAAERFRYLGEEGEDEYGEISCCAGVRAESALDGAAAHAGYWI